MKDTKYKELCTKLEYSNEKKHYPFYFFKHVLPILNWIFDFYQSHSDNKELDSEYLTFYHRIKKFLKKVLNDEEEQVRDKKKKLIIFFL
jgi:hypothetical protein